MTDRMELKTQKKEAALTVNELLYLIFFGVMLFSKGMGWYDGMRPYQLCLLIGMGCLGLKLILTKYTPWQLLVAAVFGVLGVLSWRCSAEKGMLTCVMMLIGMKDVRIKKVFQVGAVVWSSVFLYRILAFLIGWDKGILLVHKKLGAFIFRWSMGYPHPNVFHISYVILLAFLFYLLQQKGKKLFGWIVAALVGNVLIFIYSVSFTGFLLTGIYLMLVLYFELRSQFTKPEKALVPVTAALITGPQGVLLQRRPSKGLLAGLWQPLAFEGTAMTQPELDAALRAIGLCVQWQGPLQSTRHVFTHRIWQISGFCGTAAGPAPEGCVWASRAELNGEYAVPSAFAGIMRQWQPE